MCLLGSTFTYRSKALVLVLVVFCVFLCLLRAGLFRVMSSCLIVDVRWFNDTSTLVDHFVSSPREMEKRDRKDSRRNEREGQERKRNRNESEETEEIKTFPLYPYLLQ